MITTVLEHNSVLRPLYWCQEQGVELTILNCDEKGNLSYEEMENAVREKTKAIVCTHASNLTGNMINLKQVGQFTTHDDVFLVPFFSPERTRKVIMIIIYISQRAWRPSNHVK